MPRATGGGDDPQADAGQSGVGREGSREEEHRSKIEKRHKNDETTGYENGTITALAEAPTLRPVPGKLVRAEGGGQVGAAPRHPHLVKKV